MKQALPAILLNPKQGKEEGMKKYHYCILMAS